MKQTRLTETETYRYKNANPRNLISAGDCVVRAIAVATQKPWEEVFDGLVKIARQRCEMPNSDRVYNQYLQDNGWVKCGQPRKADNTLYTLTEFAYKSGITIEKGVITFIVSISGHLTTVINGQIRDTSNCGAWSVRQYWIKK